MKIKNTAILALVILSSLKISAQEIIDLPVTVSDETVVWNMQEKEYFSDIWQTQVVTNVSLPKMEVYRPDKPNGTAIIIAPGGGFYGQSIESEGRQVANWFNERGVTAFVLKYRLVPAGEDAVKEISTDKPQTIMKRVTPIVPLAVSDGLNAISHVRVNQAEYSILPNRIGFMGFSAGGAVTMGVTYQADDNNRPDFVVPVYPWTDAYPVQEAPEKAPLMNIICATDDPLDLAKGSIDLYMAWLNAGKKVELHMYERGGHGFGMRSQNLPVDDWIVRIGDWMKFRGWID